MIRIARAGAKLIIEFDSADGLHNALSPTEHMVPICTFYNRRMLTLVEYRSAYIEMLLLEGGCTIVERYSYHILSSFLLRLKMPQWCATAAAYFDPVARTFARLEHRGSHLMIVARKI